MKKKSIVFPKIPTLVDWELTESQIKLGINTKFYKDLAKSRRDAWEDVVYQYESDSKDIIKSFNYIELHPIFWKFHRVDSSPLIHEANLIDSEGISEIEFYPCRSNVGVCWNGALFPCLWLEQMFNGEPTCAIAVTYEELIIEIAKKIHKVFGNDRRRLFPPKVKVRLEDDKKATSNPIDVLNPSSLTTIIRGADSNAYLINGPSVGMFWHAKSNAYIHVVNSTQYTGIRSDGTTWHGSLANLEDGFWNEALEMKP